MGRRAFLAVRFFERRAPSPARSSYPPSAARPALAQGEKYGGLLRVSVTFGLSTINPIMHISGAEWTATRWMYSNLTRLDVKREVLPDLAESWSAGDGARVWTFKLRPGVKFHSGRELVADDVVATFTTLLDPKTASPYRGEVGPIDRVEAVDKLTVRFTMRAPFSIFPETVSVPNARIVAREGLSDLKVLAAKEFGTGPFKLKEFVPGDRLVVERFAEYFHKGQPYLDGAMLRVFPEPTTELTAFKSKEIDLISGVTPDLFSQVSTLAGAEGLAVAGGTFAAVVLPSDKPPFNDNRVRDALKLCGGPDADAGGHPERPGRARQRSSDLDRVPRLRRAAAADAGHQPGPRAAEGRWSRRRRVVQALRGELAADSRAGGGRLEGDGAPGRIQHRRGGARLRPLPRPGLEQGRARTSCTTPPGPPPTPSS